MSPMTWTRGLVVAVLATGCWCAPPTVQAQDAAPLAANVDLRSLTTNAVKLAKKGRRADAEELLSIAEELGESERNLELARTSCTKSLAKAKAVAPKVPQVAKALARTVRKLRTSLAEQGGEGKVTLATQILRLDHTCVPAHEALGHVQYGDAWVPARILPMMKRRETIRAMSQKARTIPVKVETGASKLTVFQTVFGSPGRFVRNGRYSFHTADVTEAKCARMLTHALRGLALSNWLRGGELVVPDAPVDRTFVLIDDPVRYAAAIEEAGKNGGMERERYQWVKDIGARAFWDSRGYNIGTLETEASSEVWLMHFGVESLTQSEYGEVAQPPLLTGHLNWLAMDFLGTSLYRVGFTEDEISRRKGGTAGSEVETVERERMLKIAKAGLTGTRAWMRWAASRGEDPAWSRCVVDQMGKISGFDRLKTTSVVEYLQEANLLGPLMKSTAKLPPDVASLEKGLGRSLGRLEADWREWLFADADVRGLVQRLGEAPGQALSAHEKRLLTYLNGLRQGIVKKNMQPFVEEVSLDADLTQGARLHAAYLNLHPEQTQEWPDAHEQYPDKEGFSAKGCWAGLRSVIDPGSEGPEDSIDAWMGTFYHRVPLLEPGLLRVGWALDGKVAVLDVSSLVMPMDRVVWTLWPRPNSKGLPRRFEPELPNPVPGEDQAAWGYPITLHVHDASPEPRVRLSLHEGETVDGPGLPCHLSTPDAPTNPRLVPRGVFCLIPKAHLKPMTRYTVVATGLPQQDDPTKTQEIRWAFTTGR